MKIAPIATTTNPTGDNIIPIAVTIPPAKVISGPLKASKAPAPTTNFLVPSSSPENALPIPVTPLTIVVNTGIKTAPSSIAEIFKLLKAFCILKPVVFDKVSKPSATNPADPPIDSKTSP